MDEDTKNKLLEYLENNNIKSLDSLKSIISNKTKFQDDNDNCTFVKYKTSTTNNKHYTLNVIANFKNGLDSIKISSFHDIKHVTFNKNNSNNDKITSIIVPGLKSCEKNELYIDQFNTEINKINGQVIPKSIIKKVEYSILFELLNENNNNNSFTFEIPYLYNCNIFNDIQLSKHIPDQTSCSIGNYDNNLIQIRLATTNGIFQINYPISSSSTNKQIENQKKNNVQQQQQQQGKQQGKGKQQQQQQQNNNQNGKNKQSQQQQQQQKNVTNNNTNSNEELINQIDLQRIESTYDQQLKEINQKVQDLEYKLKTVQIQIQIMDVKSSNNNNNNISEEDFNRIKLNLFSQEHTIKYEITQLQDDIRLLKQQMKLFSGTKLNKQTTSTTTTTTTTIITDSKSKDDLIKFWEKYGETYSTIKKEISEIALCQYNEFISKIKEILLKNMKKCDLVKFDAFCS